MNTLRYTDISEDFSTKTDQWFSETNTPFTGSYKYRDYISVVNQLNKNIKTEAKIEHNAFIIEYKDVISPYKKNRRLNSAITVYQQPQGQNRNTVRRSCPFSTENKKSKLLSELQKKLEDVQYITKLEYNWDGMDGKPISRSTFDVMTKFITSYLIKVYDMFNQSIDLPSIYPSMEGSIDLDWEKKTYGILINIACDGNIATYYADNVEGTQKMEGSFDPKDFNIKLLPIACDE